MNQTITSATFIAIIETMAARDPGFGEALAARLDPVMAQARVSNWSEDVVALTKILAAARG